jgi:hypothetical protein
MTDPFTVYVDRDEPVPVQTVDDLDRILDSIAANPRYQSFPVVADIVSPDDRNILQVLLGRPDVSFLVWHVDNEIIEASVGTIPIKGLVFNYGGSRTDAYDGTTIPVDIARQAVREFLTTQRRPACVEWQVPAYST